MKKFIALAAVVMFAFSTNVLAQSIDLNSDEAKKQGNKLSSIMEAEKEKQEKKDAQYIIGTFMANPSNSFKTVYFVDKNINVAFFLNGDIIQYRVLKTKNFDSVEIDMDTKYEYGYSADPHAPIAISAIVTLKKGYNKVFTTEPIYVTTGEAMDFRDAPSDPHEIIDTGAANGKTCSKCTDKYHCESNGYIGPCNGEGDKKTTKANPAKDLNNAVAASKKGSAAIPTKVITETVKVHAKDCLDKYHCDCPTKDVKRTVNKEKVHVKQHTKDCVDQYHCDCPTTVEYK